MCQGTTFSRADKLFILSSRAGFSRRHNALFRPTFDLPLPFPYAIGMTLSARNQLAGTIESITLGDIMAHVVINIGGQQVESIITRSSAESMGLKKGDSVRAVIKSTEVMVQKD